MKISAKTTTRPMADAIELIIRFLRLRIFSSLDESFLIIPLAAAQVIHYVSSLYLFLVVTATQFALDRAFFFDPLFEACDVDVLDRADAFARCAHLGICFAKVDADSALVLVVLTQVPHCGLQFLPLTTEPLVS
jgi:hypothetical protein